MKLQRNKTLSAIILILMLTVSAIMASMPTAKAHTPAWQIPNWIYVSESPTPVGVNQPVIIFWWMDKILPTSNGQYGDRYTNISITLTKPDGTTQVWANNTGDPVGGSYVTFTPTTIGTYYIQASFPGQYLLNANPPPSPTQYSTSPYIGDYYMPATSTKESFNVQQAPIAEFQQPPLPTGYWTRPVSGTNYAWAGILGNWLGPGNPGADNPTQGSINLYTTAATTAHVVWTKPIELGGIVGGANFGGLTFATGSEYERFWTSPVIIDGQLYYNVADPPRYGYYDVDLRTGQTIWYHNSTGPLLTGSQTPFHIGATNIPAQYPGISFGQLMNYNTPNQEGVKAYLWSTFSFISGPQYADTNYPGLQTALNGTSVWQMIDPLTGNWICTLYNVPTGTAHTDPNGNLLIYQFNPVAGWLALWNATKALSFPNNNLGQNTAGEAFYWMWRPPLGATIDARNGYQWNVTLPVAVKSTQVYVNSAFAQGTVMNWVGDSLILGSSGVQVYGTNSYSVWALSLAPGQQGQLLWQQPYSQPPIANSTVQMGPVDPTNGVFTVRIKESLQWYGYSLSTGNLLWGPTPAHAPFDMYGMGGTIAYGKLYSIGYAGILDCYDIKTGKVLWESTTNSGGLEGPYPYWPLGSGAGVTIAGGVVYLTTSEHSYTEPLYTGWRTYAFDANTGQRLWDIHGCGSTPIAADGYVLTLNNYDNQIYCFGKGQTATEVSASPSVVGSGGSVLIQGRIKDLSPAVQNNPAVVPDQYMGAWMEYLVEQQALPALPAGGVGVPVTLTATKSDGTTISLGTVNADCEGNFNYVWSPPSNDVFEIAAVFGGTNSYFTSYGSTSVAAVAAGSTGGTADSLGMYIIVATIVIIIAIAIAVLLLRKRP